MKPYKGTVVLESHGCKLNRADSEALARQFAEAGYRVMAPEAVEQADIYIVNTCTVTQVADRKARKALREARRRNPKATLVATGCYAQRAPQELARVEGVDLVLGNREKDTLVERVLALKGAPLTPCATGFSGSVEALGPGSARRTRAMVKIQEGCNQVCAYCIVPKVRGRERSVPLEELVRQVQARAEEGFQEVVLTGTQLGSYGFDLPGVDLIRLLARLLEATSIPRIRVSSLQPQEITPGLLALWRDKRLQPHFHIPLQSGSNRVLQAMRRRYTRELYAERVALVRHMVPHVAITTDVLVGFPGEGEREFEETFQFCQEMGFSNMHVFPYSIRPGTSAAYIRPQVAERIKRERVQKLLDLAREQAASFRRRYLGETREVLWEEPKRVNGLWAFSGLTDNYIRVYAVSIHDLGNRLTPAKLVREHGDVVWARPILLTGREGV